MQALKHFLLALQFFTRIPVTGRLAAWVGYSPQMLRASVGHFPGVGALVGALLVALAWGLLLALPPLGSATLVVAVLVTAWGLWLTGAFHEDGLADLADGLGGSSDRARALAIMKDSRIGSFGAAALMLALLAKVALLALLGDLYAERMLVALGLAQVVSRFWPLLTIALLAHVGDADGSKSKPLADRISGHSLATGLAWLLLACAVAVGVLEQLDAWADDTAWGRGSHALVAALAGSAAAWAWMTRLLRRRLQGFTGDGLGATQQVCELAFYLGWCLWP